MQLILNNRYYTMRIFVIAFLILSSYIAYAQTPTEFEKAANLYSQVTEGKRKFETLTPDEKQQFFYIQQLLSTSCGNLNGKCKDVCEAANELKSAADDLSSCAKKHDYSNDCRRRYRDTQDKFEQYESAVSEASGDCS